MTVETGLFAMLTTAGSATAALIGLRLYPVAIPQEAELPAIAYHRVSNPVGRNQAGGKLFSPRYQFDCRGKTYDDALALEDALVADLEYHQFGSVRQVHHTGAGPDDRDPDTGLFTRRVELVIWR